MMANKTKPKLLFRHKCEDACNWPDCTLEGCVNNQQGETTLLKALKEINHIVSFYESPNDVDPIKIRKISKKAMANYTPQSTAKDSEILKTALIKGEKMVADYQNTPAYTAYVVLKTAIRSFIGITHQDINEILLKEEEIQSVD